MITSGHHRNYTTLTDATAPEAAKVARRVRGYLRVTRPDTTGEMKSWCHIYATADDRVARDMPLWPQAEALAKDVAHAHGGLEQVALARGRRSYACH
jgi:hypothetical protein